MGTSLCMSGEFKTRTGIRKVDLDKEILKLFDDRSGRNFGYGAAVDTKRSGRRWVIEITIDESQVSYGTQTEMEEGWQKLAKKFADFALGPIEYFVRSGEDHSGGYRKLYGPRSEVVSGLITHCSEQVGHWSNKAKGYAELGREGRKTDMLLEVKLQEGDDA